MLHREAVSERVIDLIIALHQKTYLKEFILVGGTGLALQIGHRKSDDIDLFTNQDFNQEKLLEILEADFGFKMDFIEKNTIKGSVDEIKVDLILHKHDWIKPVQKLEGIRLASIEDISAMKINAISNDGTRIKDFIDIYFLLKEYSVEQLLQYFQTKYSLRNTLHAFKSLNYFNEVVVDNWPEIVLEKGLSWNRVMRIIDDACKKYARSLR